MKSMLKLLLIACFLQASIVSSLLGSYQSAPQMPQLVGNFPEAVMPGDTQAAETVPLVSSDAQTPSNDSWAQRIKKFKLKDPYCCCCASTITIGITALVALALLYPTDSNMSNRCYRVTAVNCGSCEGITESVIRCPMYSNGTISRAQFTEKIKSEFALLCGPEAYYEVYAAPCQENYLVCRNDHLIGFKQRLATQCAKKTRHHLGTKFMKRANNGRKR
jgi:hypothetical protein